MPDEATAVATSQGERQESSTEGQGDLGRLSSLLGEGEAEAGSGEEAQAQPTAEQAEAEAAAEGESVAETDEGEAAEFDETQLLPDEGETDYSDEVYARYAKQFSKSKGVELDPANPAHRFLLKEIIDRGRALERQKAERDLAQTEEAKADEAEKAPEEAKPAEPTSEQVQQFLTQVDKYAQGMVRPEVATVFAKEMVATLWGPKAAEKISPENAQALTKVFTKFGLLFLNDALPQLVGANLPAYLQQHYPALDYVHREGLTQAALEQLSERKDAKGQPLYGDFEDLAKSGAVEKVFRENPGIRELRFKDSKGAPLGAVDNTARQFEIAIKLARGERVNPALMQQAVEKGKQLARKADAQAKAGKLAAGETKGTFAPAKTEREQVLGEILEGSGSRLEQILHEQRSKDPRFQKSEFA